MLFFSLLLFITKKACDVMFPEKMNKIYMAIALHSLNTYAIVHCIIRKCYNWILLRISKVVFPKDTILFIKNGCEVKECNTSQLRDLIECPGEPYDMILFKHYIKPDDNSNNTFKCQVTRLSNCINRNYLQIKIPIISNIKFIDVRVSYNDKDYNIAFSSEYNYYIVGNVLFDRAFIKWHLNTYHLVVIDDDDDYICNILDDKANFIQIDSSAHIVIGLDDFSIENTNKLSDIETEETEL